MTIEEGRRRYKKIKDDIDGIRLLSTASKACYLSLSPFISLYLLLCLFHTSSLAQSSTPTLPSYYREVSATVAYLTPNNFNMLEYSCWGVGIEATAWTTPQSDAWWVARRKSPQFGLKASFGFFPQSLSGHRIGLAGILRAPLYRQLRYQIGLGLSYYTNSQYFSHDPENIFISTLVACLIDVGLVYPVGESAVVSLSLLHSSNGMLNRPNKGLNYLQLGIGTALGAPPSQSPATETLQVLPSFKRHEVGVALQLGAVVSRDLRLKPNRLFPCYDLSVGYQYYLDPVLAVGGTLDLWYNFAHREVALLDHNPYTMPLYFGALAYVEGFWGSLSIKAGIGPSVGSSLITIPFYERVGAYYNTRHTYFGVALNAHAGIIEFIEWTVGYRFGW